MSAPAPAAIVDRIRRHLVALKMPLALEHLDDLIRRFEQGQLNPYELMESLLAEERGLRESRRIKMALLTARLTTIKTLDSFDFAFQPSLDRNRVLSLASLEFIERREVVHFLGPPGTGKSHLAIALGLEAVKAGKSVYFTTLAELVTGMSRAEREGRLKERIRYYARNALLIVDEIGYLPLQSGGANLFFQLINARYERGAMILTSNRGFSEWGEIFGDPVVAAALLDRLLHHAIVIPIEGNSYRLREHAELVPEQLRPGPLRAQHAVTEQKRRRGRPSIKGVDRDPNRLITGPPGEFYFAQSGEIYFAVDTGQSHDAAGSLDRQPVFSHDHLGSLALHGRRYSFRDRTSLIAAFSSARSAYILLSSAFSASSSRIRFSSFIVTPPNFDFQLKYVARLIPYLRVSSASGTPASPSFNTATICDSVNLAFFIISPVQCGRVQDYTVPKKGKPTGARDL